MVSIKGRLHLFGPRLELPAARGVVYVGRRCTMGGWALDCSPFHNPFSAQKYGGLAAAMAEFHSYLAERPKLVDRARRELRGKRLGCFCKETQNPALCHAAAWARIVDASPLGLARILAAPVGLAAGAPAGADGAP